MKRHALSTRLWHWLNFACLAVLFMSGLNISNAHPHLYWGHWGFEPETLAGAPYYESVDLIDARHPQTIVAHALNREPLPIANGAPLRMRIERQLGYKHAKYLTAIKAVASLDGIGGGKGGYWEDRGDYQWYAGI